MPNETITEILKASSRITVVNDGQVRYPVLTENLNAWILAFSEITAANYQKFCSDVDYIGAKIGVPGSADMNDLCSSLIDAGSDYSDLSRLQ